MHVARPGQQVARADAEDLGEDMVALMRPSSVSAMACGLLVDFLSM